MDFWIHSYVEEEASEQRYSGRMEVNKVKFTFRLEFCLPLSRMDELGPVKDADDLKRRVTITVRRDGEDDPVVFTDKSWEFFYNTIIVSVIKCHDEMRKGGSNVHPTHDVALYNFTPAIVDMLREERLVCAG